VARLRRLSRIQASRSASLSHYSRQRSAIQPFLTPIFSTVLCPPCSMGVRWSVLTSVDSALVGDVCRAPMASAARATSRLAHKFAWSEFEQPKAGPEGEGQDARSKDAVEAGQVGARWRHQGREFGDEKSAGLPIWTTAGRPQGGAQGCAPSTPPAQTPRASCRFSTAS